MQTTAFRMETKFDKTSSTTVPQETSENSFRHIATEGSQQSSHRLENTQEETVTLTTTEAYISTESQSTTGARKEITSRTTTQLTSTTSIHDESSSQATEASQTSIEMTTKLTTVQTSTDKKENFLILRVWSTSSELIWSDHLIFEYK